MRQAELILEYYDNRIKEVQAGCRCSPQLRAAVTHYNGLLKMLTLPQAYAIAMGDQEAWKPIDDALGAVWHAIDQEDAGQERKGIRDELREIRQLAEGVVRRALPTSQHASAAQGDESGTHAPSPLTFPPEGNGVVCGDVFYAVDEMQLAILRLLVDTNGNWISSSEMRSLNPLLDDERIDRHIRRLPKQVRRVIDGKTGKGYRLKPATVT